MKGRGVTGHHFGTTQRVAFVKYLVQNDFLLEPVNVVGGLGRNQRILLANQSMLRLGHLLSVQLVAAGVNLGEQVGLLLRHGQVLVVLFGAARKLVFKVGGVCPRQPLCAHYLGASARSNARVVIAACVVVVGSQAHTRFQGNQVVLQVDNLHARFG